MDLPGKFVISLDFELFWGMRDHKTLEDYGPNILGVWEAMPRMLDLFQAHDVKATFATVGFLFANSKEELIRYVPKEVPQYEEERLSPYNGHFDQVKANEVQDKYHFASELIKLIKTYPGQEIATHTFSHYYCISEGQTIHDFDRDIKAAKSIAAESDVELISIVFPRNMFNEEYIRVCEENGIIAYRGNEKVWFHNSKMGMGRLAGYTRKVLRFLNSYINLSGHHCYTVEEIASNRPYDIPSSRFLRPYNHKLKAFENIRIRRIKNSMTYAAKNGLVFHLWWHPHNFGAFQKENFAMLEELMKHYSSLKSEYGFESVTMGEFAREMDKTYV